MRNITLLIFAILLSLASCREKRAVDDQGRTSACWIYAMMQCIEHEADRRGDSVRLSRQWLIGKILEEQTTERYLMRSQTKDDGNAPEISLRGVGPDALRLIERYGLVPYEHEKTGIENSNAAERKLTIIADNARSLSDLQDSMDDVLPQFTIAKNAYVDRKPMGGAFYYLSMRYNPYQFAESIMYYQHWNFFASVPYHPYGVPFSLEVPDNYRRHEYMNIPMNELVRMVMTSLRKGHAVYWEYGSPTPDGGRTSRHAMAIIGLRQAKGSHEVKLLCKNSYGKDWGNHGTCIVSLEDFKNNTCNVGIVSE